MPDSTTFIELQTIRTVPVTNTSGVQEEAIPLSKIIAAVVAAPSAMTYNMLSLDAFGPTTAMSWTKFQTGYWLLTSQTTLFTDTTLTGGRYKLKVLQKLIVKP